MNDSFSPSMGDLILIFILLLAAGWALYSCLRKKGCAGCPGGCGGACGRSCACRKRSAK